MYICVANSFTLTRWSGPTIISAFGFTAEQTTLLSMAPGAAAVAGSLVSLMVAKYTSRTIAGISTLLLSCIGTVMMLAIPPSHAAARYGGYILTLQCTLLSLQAQGRPLLTLPTVPVSVLFVITFMTAGVGGSTKKLAFGASYQLGYTVGNIIGPQTYRESDAPNYYVSQTSIGWLTVVSGLITSFI